MHEKGHKETEFGKAALPAMHAARWFLAILATACMLHAVRCNAQDRSPSRTVARAATEMPLWQTTLPARLLAEPVAAAPHALELHHFDMDCGSCHAPASEVRQAADPQAVGPVHTDINRACSSGGCHQQNAVLDHPVGVTVSASIAGDRPLQNSRITCLTCHDSPSDAGAQQQLVVPQGNDLCASCHSRMPGGLRQRAHWRFSTQAHLRPSTDTSDLASDAFPIGRVDAESHTCLSCHTNVAASVPIPGESVRQRKARQRSMSDHPVGMDFARSAAGKPARFNRLMPHQSPIRLFDGRVGCGSCHSPYSDRPDNLVMHNTRGNLCRQCHNM